MADTKSEEKAPAAAPVQFVPITADAISAALQQQQAAMHAELQAHPRDVTIPGGRILRDGVLVNAWGHEIESDGKLKNPDDRFHESI